jgi:hypothetical protein
MRVRTRIRRSHEVLSWKERGDRNQFRGVTCGLETAGQYLSNELILEQSRNRGEEIGPVAESLVESVERCVGEAVPVSDFHRGRLGFGDPAVQDSALPDSGTRRCRCRIVAGLA